MKNLKLLLPYMMRYKKIILLGFLFVTISNICSTYAPRIVGNAVDMLQKSAFSHSDIMNSIVYFLLLTAGSGIFMFLTRKTIIISSRLIEYDLRKDFIEAVGTQPLSFFNVNPTGTLMAYSSNDIAAAREFLGPAVMYGVNTVTTFSFALYFMLKLNPLITVFGLLPLPVIAVFTYFLGNKIHVAFRDVQDRFAKLTTQAQESFSGIRIIKAYLRENYEKLKFETIGMEYLTKNLYLAKIYSAMMPSFLVLVGLSQLMVLGFGGYQVLNNKASYGDLTQFFIYINLLIWPIAAIGWVTNLVQRAAASAGRLKRIFDSMPEKNYNSGRNFKIVKGNIEFCDISLRYSGNLDYSLDNISLTVEKGSSLGIVGLVGSGKTSLINLLTRLYEPGSGKILLGDTDIRNIPLESLRSSIGCVPQDTFLFSMTIEENIRFGKPDASFEEISEAVRIAHFKEEIEGFPEAFETMLGERGITLSGGQKQRLAIARAIIKNPDILILDDALSAVDTQTEEKILSNLRQFMRNRTFIIISHRISTVMNCDNIIVLDKGRIIERGTHEQLRLLGGNYAKLFNRQQLEAEIESIY